MDCKVSLTLHELIRADMLAAHNILPTSLYICACPHNSSQEGQMSLSVAIRICTKMLDPASKKVP